MATYKESQEECCEVQYICMECNRELWGTLCYGRPVEAHTQHHLCPECYERAKREGTLEPAVPRYEPRAEKAEARRMSIGEIIENLRKEHNEQHQTTLH